MKFIMRWRWALVATLLLVLYFFDKGRRSFDIETYLLLFVVLAIWTLSEKLDRIETKLDTISKRD